MSIVASYDGMCPECGDAIVADLDDIAESLGVGWVHVDCAPAPDTVKPGKPFSGFGQASRAGHTGRVQTLADKLKGGAR